LNSTAVAVTVITGLVKSEKEEEASLGWTFHWKARGGSFTRKGHEKVNRALKGRGKETLSSLLHKVFTKSEWNDCKFRYVRH
jgi:hypothetical protein